MSIGDATRREFLKTAAGTALLAGSVPGFGMGQEAQEAEEPAGTDEGGQKLRIAFIGAGGIGGYHLNETKDLGVSCPCYCDVDTNRMKKASEMYPGAKPYQDYRELFDKEHKNFDAVMVGTPDHHHYPATVIAMQLGKHVYTQKPLTHTPWEARQLTLAAEKYKVATQMGNQGHAGEGWRLVVEWIQSGALGDIVETHTWTDRPIWPQGLTRPEGEDTVPSHVNWDAWLGPAPARAFKKDTYHPFKWRGWWDFGAGALGDMACHTMDGVFWALEPGHPISVEPIAQTPMNGETFPDASMVKWRFGARGKRPAFDAYWYDGGLLPTRPQVLETKRRMPGSGNLFVGTKASMLVAGDYGNSPRIIPEARMKEIGKPARVLERSPGHVKEWVMACKGEKPLDYPKSNFAYSGPFSEVILLGNVALRVGKRLDWDSARMAFTNAPEANAYLTKEYRDGWKFTI